jgi:hypothetical protein
MRATTYLWDLVSPFQFSPLFRQVQPYTLCSRARLRKLFDARWAIRVTGEQFLLRGVLYQ